MSRWRMKWWSSKEQKPQKGHGVLVEHNFRKFSIIQYTISYSHDFAKIFTPFFTWLCLLIFQDCPGIIAMIPFWWPSLVPSGGYLTQSLTSLQLGLGPFLSVHTSANCTEIIYRFKSSFLHCFLSFSFLYAWCQEQFLVHKRPSEFVAFS